MTVRGINRTNGYFWRDNVIAPEILGRMWFHFTQRDWDHEDRGWLIHSSETLPLRLLRKDGSRGHEACRLEGDGWYIAFTYRRRRSRGGDGINWGARLWSAEENQFDHEWALALLAV